MSSLLLIASGNGVFEMQFKSDTDCGGRQSVQTPHWI